MMFRREQVKKLKLGSNDYPYYLSQVPSPPKALYVVGDEKILKQKSLTVVGSRKMSLYGRRMADKFSKELVGAGLVIVSGLARGIDGVAHRACLEAGGKTVAVLGHGFDKMYPPEHRGLAKQIVMSGGLLLTEFYWGDLVERKNFLMRDRIMAGLSLGTLVVEGRHRSGTKATATQAANCGREVFAVPGPIDSELSEATADLIQEGAKLVTKIEDILEEIRL